MKGWTFDSWIVVLVRFAWTRPLACRVAILLGVAYTIVAMVVATVDSREVLLPWFVGVLCALFGWGLTRTARRLTAADLEHDRRRSAADLHLWLFDQLFARLPLPVARGTEFLMGAILIAAGAALAVMSMVGSVLAL